MGIAMLRFFERIDRLEDEVKRLIEDQKEVAGLLLSYVDADLAKPWEPSAQALAEKLREIIKK
jgi:hypothetical protein